MKRILSMLACAALVVCSCQKDPKPALSFETGNYVMGADEALTVKVVTTQAPASDLTVEFTATGSAVKGTDYEFSAESFTIKAGETTGEITVTPLNNLGTNLTINLALTLPVGYEAGNFTSALVALGTKEKASYSFAKKESKLVDEVEIVLNLIGETSTTNFVAGGEISLPFVIESTAVAGTDYEVKNGATAFVFAKGQKSASITLKSLVADPESIKEIVVKLDETAIAAAYGERFSKGVIASTKVIITKGLIFSDLEGKWAYANAPILDDPEADYFTFGGMLDEAGDGGFNEEFTGIIIPGFPAGTASDILEFKTVNGQPSLVPSGNGTVLNYFKECEVSDFSAGKYNWYFYSDKDNPMGKEYDITNLKLSKVNAAYSATVNTEKEGAVMVSLSEDGNTLHVFISDYTPTDFYANTYAFYDSIGMWADMAFYFDLYFTFTRVTE